jgi:hypothetical protein
LIASQNVSVCPNNEAPTSNTRLLCVNTRVHHHGAGMDTDKGPESAQVYPALDASSQTQQQFF